ncbi:hypothetical protein [Streptomyces purpureus]|uniref:hypothetical protein n=1 Tax=Streptomyces purpureus TaxID=1951 RepID=UPI00131A3662|nr:hypothetical protein [Streptomyces purpureus]
MKRIRSVVGSVVAGMAASASLLPGAPGPAQAAGVPAAPVRAGEAAVGLRPTSSWRRPTPWNPNVITWNMCGDAGGIRGVHVGYCPGGTTPTRRSAP